MKQRIIYLLGALLFLVACTYNGPKKSNEDPLPSWNDTEMKAKIIGFVEKQVPKIPLENRLAVFDMDGTIACEEPLWLEMYCAVQGLCLKADKDTTLRSQMIYQLADSLRVNPKSQWAQSQWGPYIDTMVHTAFAGWDNEAYIAFSNKLVNTEKQPDYGMLLINTFYPPMIELISYLKENQFDIYIVSGSLQGLLWSVCPQAISFERSHLIGTRQQMNPVFYPDEKTAFILQPDIWAPNNDDNGKALNIYSYIGKTPVFAFGNTTGDFGMFRLTSTNTLPHACFLLNHDDAQREYVYPPWHGDAMPAWQDTMKNNGWNIVDMSKAFKTVWRKAQ